MRRPVTILAGLLLAAGSSFAMALPASAALSHGTQPSAVSHNLYDWDDDEYYFNSGDEWSNEFDGEFRARQDQDQDVFVTNTATATNNDQDSIRGDDNDVTYPTRTCTVGLLGLVCIG